MFEEVSAVALSVWCWWSFYSSKTFQAFREKVLKGQFVVDFGLFSAGFDEKKKKHIKAD